MYFTPGLYIVLSVCRSHWKFLNYQNYSLCISCIVSEIFRWPERSPEDERRLIGGQERRRQIDTVGEMNRTVKREESGMEASSKHYTWKDVHRRVWKHPPNIALYTSPPQVNTEWEDRREMEAEKWRIVKEKEGRLPRSRRCWGKGTTKE